MNKVKRWSHKKIQDYLMKNGSISALELDYWLRMDYTDAQIMRRACGNSKRTVVSGLCRIKSNLVKHQFKKLTAKLVKGGIKIECSPLG